LSGLKTDGLFPTPAWAEVRKLDFDARLAAIRDENIRLKLVDEAKGMPYLLETTKNYYWLGDADQPTYTRGPDESLASIAKAASEHPVETWLRYMLESNGETLFHVRFFNHDLDKVNTFLHADWVLPGIGDAGAHVSQIMDSGWTSFLLGHWHRDQGTFSLAEAVRKLTSAQARVIGLDDRGTLAAGKRADINVIDVNRVAERQPQLVHDFPEGAPRLIQKAVGYQATVCNGHVILENDEHTGACGGRVLRNSASA
ncbi:MAG: amidohydrolase family protein, partial [Pseudomonadales bacterium]|nr:amidohydrolase family protein [Pseudomonadales bacterium]